MMLLMMVGDGVDADVDDADDDDVDNGDANDVGHHDPSINVLKDEESDMEEHSSGFADEDMHTEEFRSNFAALDADSGGFSSRFERSWWLPSPACLSAVEWNGNL